MKTVATLLATAALVAAVGAIAPAYAEVAPDTAATGDTPSTTAGDSAASTDATDRDPYAIPVDSVPELAGADTQPAPTASGSADAADVCFFAADGDHVHKSNGQASGHGWWDNLTCPSGTRANVTIWLEEKLGGTWYLQGTAQTGYNRLPGSGSSQRVTAKMFCVNSTTHTWRSQIAVDLVGRADTTPVATTDAQSIACY